MPKKQANIWVLQGGPNSEWQQLPADALARLHDLLGWDVNLYLAPAEFARVFNIGFAEGCAENESGVSLLLTRLQQAGAVYKRTSLFAICQGCGYPGSQSQQCNKCGGNIISAEREGYYLRIQKYSEKIIALISSENVVLPKFQQGYILNCFSNMPAEDYLLAIKVSRDKQELLPVDGFSELASVLTGSGYSVDDGGFQRLWPNTYFFFPENPQRHYIGAVCCLHLISSTRRVCFGTGLSSPEPAGDQPLLLAQITVGTASVLCCWLLHLRSIYRGPNHSTHKP